ncbi:MAG: polysaccharide export protein [Magnetococcales bacterium]|nr:polysaccharide export protein [Magnetococcales bacterium]
MVAALCTVKGAIRTGLRLTLLALLKLTLLWCFVRLGVMAGPENMAESDYRLGAGDVIQVTVNDEPDLTLQSKISLNGKFSFSFLGEIHVAGLTVKELEELLKTKLLDGYLLKPVVFVSIVEHRIYFVNGEVDKAGGYPFKPGLTVRKAVVLAGGFKERADRDRIVVIRGNDPLYKEKPIGMDDRIYPGDIVTVQESFW